MLYMVDRAPHCSPSHTVFGAFSRSWIAPAITTDNWRERGMLRWFNGRIIYVCITRAVEYEGVTESYGIRVSLPDGQAVSDLCSTWPTLDAALAQVRPGVDTILGSAPIVEPHDYPPDRGSGSLLISRAW